MAIDDAILAMTASVSGGGGTVNIQPSAGDEYLLHRIGLGQGSGGTAPNKIPDGSMVFVDGTSGAGFTRVSGTPEESAALTRAPYHIHFTNAIYIQFYNDNASAGAFSFSATETK